MLFRSGLDDLLTAICGMTGWPVVHGVHTGSGSPPPAATTLLPTVPVALALTGTLVFVVIARWTFERLRPGFADLL